MNKILNITAILSALVILIVMGVFQIRTQNKMLDASNAMIEGLEAQIDEHQTALKVVPGKQSRATTLREIRTKVDRPLLEGFTEYQEEQAITDSISVIMPGTPTWSRLTKTEQEQNHIKIERLITTLKDADRSPTWAADLFLNN